MSKVKEISSEEQFRDILRNSGNKLVIVDYFATWCGPCMAAAPQFANLSTKYANVVFVKVDTDKNRSITSNAGVKALPTFMLYKNNVKLTEFSGADMQKLEQLIAQYGDTFESFKGSGKTLSSSSGSGSGGMAGKAVDRSVLLKRFGGLSAEDEERKKRLAASSSSSSSLELGDQTQKAKVATMNETGLTEEELDNLTEEQLLKRAIELSMKQQTESEKSVEEQPAAVESKTGALPVLDIVLDKDEKVPTQEDVDKKVEEMVDNKVLSELLEMEFSKTRALKALLATGGKNQESAIEWLVEHQTDEDIDDPIQFKVITYEEQQQKLKAAKEKAKQLQAEARKKVELIEKQNAKERERRRITEGKATLQTLREIEEAQKRRDAEAAKFEKKKLAEERARVKRIQEEDQAKRRIERLKREGKLEEVAEIEREFGWTPSVSASSSASSSSSSASASSAAASNECVIRLRLLNGETQACSFSPNDPLQTVFDHAVLLQQGNKRFSLITPMPRKVYKGADLKQTLKQLGLCPKCQLICSPAV